MDRTLVYSLWLFGLWYLGCDCLGCGCLSCGIWAVANRAAYSESLIPILLRLHKTSGELGGGQTAKIQGNFCCRQLLLKKLPEAGVYKSTGRIT